MKKEDWFHSFSLADDKYIEEAHPDRIVKPQRKRLIVSVIAACACFALLFSNLWLFVPFNTSPPDVSRYKGSEYYGLIQKLNELTFEKPKYKNNAEKLKDKLENISLGAMGSGGLKGEATGTPENDGITDTNGAYKEITDNQVEGIIEADRIKRSDTHI